MGIVRFVSSNIERNVYETQRAEHMLARNRMY